MPIIDLYTTSEQRRNLAHFATLASLAAVDGEVNAREKALLDSFAMKLSITKEEYKEVMKKSNKYPIQPYNNEEERYERLYDLFRIIYADHSIEDEQMTLIKKYAIGLGFPSKKANKILEKSVAIFSGKIDFKDYLQILKS
ncbi:MAG: TerB family tellurite resistance protein [Eudoraea sp.]